MGVRDVHRRKVLQNSHHQVQVNVSRYRVVKMTGSRRLDGKRISLLQFH